MKTAPVGRDQGLRAIERLAERLERAVAPARGAQHLSIALSLSATAVVVQGAPAPLATLFLEHLETTDDVVADLTRLWSLTSETAPYLRGRLGPLLGWMDRPVEGDAQAARACAGVLARASLGDLLASPQLGGDVLGPLYACLRSHSSAQSLGAFYTPMPVSAALAALCATSEGDAVHEPSCGSGGMLVAVARDMRSRGLDPATCSWVLNDVDPTAVALAGVNALAHGFGPSVTLTCGDTLSQRCPT